MTNIEWRIEDPTESLEPTGDPWIILDVGVGVDRITVIEDLDQLERVKGSSVHDFDVYMELKLRKKLGKLPKIIIIVIPNYWSQRKAINSIEAVME